MKTTTKQTNKQNPQILSKTKETYEQDQAHPPTAHTPKAPAAITEQKQLCELLTCCLFFHPAWHRQIVSWFYLDNSLFVCLFVFLFVFEGTNKKSYVLISGITSHWCGEHISPWGSVGIIAVIAHSGWKPLRDLSVWLTISALRVLLNAKAHLMVSISTLVLCWARHVWTPRSEIFFG